jgi:hypothetical protein
MIVDSTDPRRNKPLAGGVTQVQLDFQKNYIEGSRERVIELSVSQARHLKAAGKTDGNLLDEIIRRCAKADPKIVELAKAAKAKIKSDIHKSHSHSH